MISITDYDYSFKIEQEKKAEIITNKINGRLEALIINSDKPCEIYISFSELDICLYKNIHYYGINYIPLRISSLDKEHDMFNFAPVKWALNNKLKIEVRGQINTKISITLRIS